VHIDEIRKKLGEHANQFTRVSVSIEVLENEKWNEREKPNTKGHPSGGVEFTVGDSDGGGMGEFTEVTNIQTKKQLINYFISD
jgi:hypothetical protein